MAAGMRSIPDVVILGNATIDDLVFGDGSTRMAQPGGNALYAATGAILWGLRVGVCAVVGPEYPLRHLAGEQLDESGIRRVNEPSLRNWGLYEDDGTCQYIFRGGSGPHPHERFSPEVTDIPSTYRGAQYAHLAPVPLHRALNLLDALSEVRERGGVSMDPDVRWCGSVSRENFGRLMDHLSFFLPSQREAALLYPGLTPADILRRIRDDYPRLRVAVIKLAAEGCAVYDRVHDSIRHLPAFPARVMDTTGAGDAFCGGFLAGYAMTEDGFLAAMHGLVSASHVVEAYGLPRISDLGPSAGPKRLDEYRATVAKGPTHRYAGHAVPRSAD